MKYSLLILSSLFLVYAVGTVNAQEARLDSARQASSDVTVIATTTPTPSTAVTSENTRRNAMLTQGAERRSAILTQAATRKETAASKAAERKDQRQETVIENLRRRAINEIDRRIKSLTEIIDKVNALKKLSPEQKTTTTAQIQTEIDNLTTLKSKIEADTDLETIKADAKSVIASYRIYALFIPKIHILTGAEATLTAIERMTGAYDELNTRVGSAKSAGTDTTQMDTLLTSMQSMITDATTNANTAISTVSPLTPDGYPENKESLSAARENLKTARRDLMEAHKSAKELMKLLRRITFVTPTTATTSAVTTN